MGVGLTALALRAALLPFIPIPEPTVHDEFSYLLGGDTFRLGRVTNPPHPMWKHFETFHVNFQPTYASKYPPAQALVLALGWKLFGHPWYGVWLSCGLMCAALCWMLQGWLAPRYALIGGLLAVAQWSVFGYWIDSYWGGAVAAAAGALVLGAVPRLARRPTAGVACMAAFGVVVLANSRPYEGGLTALAAAAALVYELYRRHRLPRLFTLRVVLPAIAILACGIAFIGYYNYRVTGDPILMPYALHQTTYGASPIFWLAPLPPLPIYRHDEIRKFWVGPDKLIYDLARSSPFFVLTAFLGMLRFFLTPVSAMALFTSFLRLGRKVKLALATLAVPVTGLLLERYALAHYFAPAAGLLLLLVMLGVQFLRVRFGRRVGFGFAVVLIAVAGIQAAMRAQEYFHRQFAENRANVAHALSAAGGKNLIFVRYKSNHNLLEEWVYNSADIDGSQVVWARDMGDSGNRELVEYYKNRKSWLLDADQLPMTPVPYAPPR